MTLHDSKTPARNNESGMVLVTAILVMALMTVIMGGMIAAINSEQRTQGIDRDQTQAYAAAHAGLEKLTSDLVSLFVTDVSPTVDEINALTAFTPEIDGFEFTAPGGGANSGYAINFDVVDGNPRTLPNSDITAGPYQGFKGLITPFSVTVTARSAGGAEVRLRRDLQTVAVPVFQFGVFSDTDLTFYAGDDFDFGGRVHTNANLYLSQVSGRTLKFTDRITALSQVVRTHLSNGLAVSNVGFTGTVNVATEIGTPGTYRHLKHTGPIEASVLGFPGATPAPDPNKNWWSLSVGTYKNNIRTGETGAKRLDLPIVSQGASPIDLIRRPASDDEDDVAPLLFGQRYFSFASLRILLSDRAADITDLPGVTATAPVELGGNWLTGAPIGYAGVDATHPPIAQSIGPILGQTTSNSSGGSYSSGLAQIYMCTGGSPCNGVPAGFQVPELRDQVTNNVITCRGKTDRTFFGCTFAGIAATGTVRATLPSGLVVSAPFTSVSGSSPNRIITLSTATTLQPTAPFSPGLIWVNNSTGVPLAVTCEGYDTVQNPPRFTNCRGLTSTPGTNRTVSSHAHAGQGTGLIGGFLKIEQQDDDGVWTDVTMEILNLGFGASNYDGTVCADPTPNAVLRIQRLRDNGNATSGGGAHCSYAGSRNPHDWWANGLYDAREGNYRDVGTTVTDMEMGGIFQYIEIDVRNLKRWLNGTIGATGTNTLDQNGYIVYFSDRRGNHNWTHASGTNPETGEYGWEDVVNPASATGVPNGVLNAGEDANSDGVLQTYGSTPGTLVIPAATNPTAPFTTALARPTTGITAAQARVNRTVLFRRALRLSAGGIVSGVNNLPTSGLTVASENPVYVEGNYNATTSATAEPNVPAAILADAVTVLSNNWSDARSFRFPNSATDRPATTTAYRFAVLAGKNRAFTYPTAGSPQFLFGTDGGVGNFLRLLENWNISGVSINYSGSLVSLYFSRQATGTFRFSPNVYSFGDRNFAFDSDFLIPALLPPGTPMFRDVNTLTFRQILRPNQ